MDISRIYDTTVAHREHGLAIRFTTIPAASVPNWSGPEDLITRLDLRDSLEKFDSPSAVPLAVASLLFGSAWIEPDVDEVLARFKELLGKPPDEALQGLDEAGLASFANYVSRAELVPIESSPLGLTSLIAAAVTPGATAGIAIIHAGAVSGPLIFLVMPASILLCAPASAAALVLTYEILKRTGVLGEADPEKRASEARKVKEVLDEAAKENRETARLVLRGRREDEGPGSKFEEQTAQLAHMRLSHRGRAPSMETIKKVMRYPQRLRRWVTALFLGRR